MSRPILQRGAFAATLAHDCAGILDAWFSHLDGLPLALLRAPTPSRGRSLRNLTVNVYHPFELLPDVPGSARFDWDPDGDDLASSLEFDLGQVQALGGMSFSQRTQRLGWHQYFRYELKARSSEGEPWQSVYQGHSCLGGVPVLELKTLRARFLRLELIKPRRGVPVQLAELRIFSPLPGMEVQ